MLNMILFTSISELTRGAIAIIVGAIIGAALVLILGSLLCRCYCKPAKKEVIEDAVPSPMVADENLEKASRGITGTI